MSLETWMEEAYPISADEAAKGTWVNAIEHSLRKWKHADEDTLKKHGVKKNRYTTLYGINETTNCAKETNATFSFSSSTCAMCVKAINDCNECLGAKANDHACSEYNEYKLRISSRLDCADIPFGEEYKIWVDTGDNKPMVEWLEKALIYSINERQGRGI